MMNEAGRRFSRRLLRLGSCLLSDALDQLGLAGAVSGLQPVTARRGIAGLVVTVALGPSGRRRGANRPHLAASVLSASRGGGVVVVANQGRTGAASWGGLLSAAAKRKGFCGAIVDGACRDVDEARQLGFPVYAGGVTPRTARGRFVEAGSNQPVRIRGVRVSPGDWAVADSSGVVFLKAKTASRVLQAADELGRREKSIRRALIRGGDIAQGLGVRYERMLRRR